MKKYIAIILGVIMITSCTKGLENQAKDQLKKTMKEVLKNPDSATLSNVKTLVNNDSLCVIQFTCKAQNGFGGYATSNQEYIYIKISNDDGKVVYKEALFDLDKTKSVIQLANNLNNELSSIMEKNKIEKKKKTTEERERDSINSIYLEAQLVTIFKGREIQADEGEEIKLN